MTTKEAQELIARHEKNVALALQVLESEVQDLMNTYKDIEVCEAILRLSDNHKSGWDAGYAAAAKDCAIALMGMLRRGKLSRMDTNKDVEARLMKELGISGEESSAT